VSSTRAERRARLEPLLESARSLVDGTSTRGKFARERLVEASGLSRQGVDFALKRCLEANPSEAELSTLLASTPEAPRAQVLLSANVFVAAHRAIALALAAAPLVFVRASRREPAMTELLLDGARGSFELMPELEPRAGDQLWAYGSDETLRDVARKLPPGVSLHAHGTGFGVGVIDGALADTELEAQLARFSEDVALFDQRGCLSPRALLVQGSSERTREVARVLARRLAALEAAIPRGTLQTAELAEIARYRDSAVFCGELFDAGSGFVSVGVEFALPPIGRNVHVFAAAAPARTLASLAEFITVHAVEGKPELRAALAEALPSARSCAFGGMQTPPFDGPVDRRQRRF
jgi:hypothetical protein